MGRLAFLADEHVDRAYVAGLRTAGYETAAVGQSYAAGTSDVSLLGRCREQERVLLTNDRDFVRLGRSRDHAGIVVYTEQVAPVGEFVGALQRMDSHFSPNDVWNTILWLEEWT